MKMIQHDEFANLYITNMYLLIAKVPYLIHKSIRIWNDVFYDT